MRSRSPAPARCGAAAVARRPWRGSTTPTPPRRTRPRPPQGRSADGGRRTPRQPPPAPGPSARAPERPTGPRAAAPSAAPSRTDAAGTAAGTGTRGPGANAMPDRDRETGSQDSEPEVIIQKTGHGCRAVSLTAGGVADSARSSGATWQILRGSPAARGRRPRRSACARMARTAAAAPVRVVMHGTPCIIAARRTARSSKNDSRPSGVLMTSEICPSTISSAMFGRPSFTLKTTSTSRPCAPGTPPCRASPRR